MVETEKRFLGRIIVLRVLFLSLGGIRVGCRLQTEIHRIVMELAGLFSDGIDYRLARCFSMDCFMLVDGENRAMKL